MASTGASRVPGTTGSPDTTPDVSSAGCVAPKTRSGVGIFNLGTGVGSSVFDVIHAFEKACDKTLPFTIKPRRAGDIAENYASCEKAKLELNWQARFDLETMCKDSWNWQSRNPDGYRSDGA